MAATQGVLLVAAVLAVAASALHASSRADNAPAGYRRSTILTPNLACADANLEALRWQISELDRYLDRRIELLHAHDDDSTPIWTPPDDVVVDLAARAAALRAFVNRCTYVSDAD